MRGEKGKSCKTSRGMEGKGKERMDERGEGRAREEESAHSDGFGSGID